MKNLLDKISTPYNPRLIAFSIFFILLIFGILHTTTWFLYTKTILFPKSDKIIGDLVRLSCEIDSANPRAVTYTLNKKHIQGHQYKNQKIDILTIGDSFSNGGGGGENRFYQDYIESIHNKRVLNIPPADISLNKIEMIVAMYNNGLLDKIKPKIIILESIERFIVQDFAKKINWEYLISKKTMLNDMKSNIYNPNLEKENNSTDIIPNFISIINSRNYDCIINPIYYKYGREPIDRNNLVYKFSLSKNMFSAQAQDKLLFLKQTIITSMNNNLENIKKVNNNISKLAKLLKKKNIKLIFMPIPDRYNLYSSYIIDNPFPEDNFFKLLRKLKKNYYFIDTKAILQNILETRKDIFHSDDTHWTHVASEEIIKNVNFENILDNNI